MTANDIVMRGGMLIAAIVLLSIFTGNLTSLRGEREMDRFNDIADEMATIFRTLDGSDPPSTISISFDDDIEGSFMIDGKIRGQRPYLRVLPGAMFLEMEGERLEIAVDANIIPSFPPKGGLKFSMDAARNISMASGGYRIKIWGIIIMEKVEPGFIFIHPERGYGSNSALDELCEMMDEPFLPSIEWDRDLVMSNEEVFLVHEDHFILFHDNLVDVEDGICPIPYILSASVEIEMTSDDKDCSGNILIHRRAVPFSDGYLPHWIMEKV